jgi:hypothetical protein
MLESFVRLTIMERTDRKLWKGKTIRGESRVRQRILKFFAAELLY